MPEEPTETRRELLASVAGSGVGATAGCASLGGLAGGDGSEPATPTPVPASDVSIDTERDVQFRETPERPLHLDLTRARDEVVRPLLVHLHGGGWRRGDNGYAHAERMARAGAVVASAQYRLSGEATFPAAVRDVVAAVKWLRATADDHGIDPDRVALTGESAGGHLAALVAAAPGAPEFQPPEFHPDVPVAVDAVVPVSGIYDLRIGHLCVSEIVRGFLGGTCEEHPDAARTASPIAHLDGDHPPVLAFHGTDDQVIRYRQATRYRDALTDAGVDVALHTAEGGGHLLGDHAEAFLPEQAQFLQRELSIE